jgi:thioredoxin-related protein
MNMQRLPDWLRIPLNHYGFLSIPALPIVVLLLLLGLDGFTVADTVIIGVVFVAMLVFWSRTHARQTADAPKNATSLMDSIKQSGKYAMLALESEYCLSSTSVGKHLMELESTYPEDFQILSLSIFKAPGKDLFKEHSCRVTPTYLLIDPEGKVVMDYPLVLPVERIKYAVTNKRATQEMTRPTS